MDAHEQNERKLERNQELMLAGLTMGAMGFVAEEVVEVAALGETIGLVASLITLAGLLTFAAALMLNYRFNRNEMLTDLIDDERSQFTRHAAYSVGFAAVIATQVLVAVGTPVLNKLELAVPSPAFFASLTIFVGLIAALAAYRILDR